MEKNLFFQMVDNEKTHWWFVGRRNILDRIIAALGLGKDALILEAGCGTGGNLPMLAKYGTVHAMEYDDTALEFARDLGIGCTVKGMLPDRIPFGDTEFDLIVLLDVLEHVEDDRRALIALKERLKPEGKMVISVPAFPFLWSRHDEVHHHYRRYTRSHLLNLLESAGLSSEFTSYFNTFLFPGICLLRFLHTIMRRQEIDNVGNPFPLANRLLSAFFGAEKYLMRLFRLPFGVSLLSVCRKKEGATPTKEAAP